MVPCRLLEISGSTFDQMLRKNPEIAVRMMRKLSRRLRDTDSLLREALGSEESQAPEVPHMEEGESAKGPERLIDDALADPSRLGADLATLLEHAIDDAIDLLDEVF